MVIIVTLSPIDIDIDVYLYLYIYMSLSLLLPLTLYLKWSQDDDFGLRGPSSFFLYTPCFPSRTGYLFPDDFRLSEEFFVRLKKKGFYDFVKNKINVTKRIMKNLYIVVCQFCEVRTIP